MARFVISDIHGCLKTFQALVAKIGLKTSDELYLLGDYINKGPDSKGVLDYIIRLISQNFKITCIRGNHDQMLLDAQLINTCWSWCTDLQKINTLKSFGVAQPQDIPERYIIFIRNMPLYLELENYFLVHAGFFFGIKDPFLDTASLLNIKQYQYDREEMKGKGIIQGHVPQPVKNIVKAVRNKDTILKIDAGCVYYKNNDYGSMVAINIDSYEIFTQPNIDFPYEVIEKKNT